MNVNTENHQVHPAHLVNPENLANPKALTNPEAHANPIVPEALNHPRNAILMNYTDTTNTDY